jgi:hypothetical protein
MAFFNVLRGIIRWCVPYGIIMFRRKKHTRKKEHKPEERTGYEQVSPYATYAPWKTDDIFSSSYDIVKNNTLVDKYRCYELWQLVKESSKLEGGILEIGVWRGGTGALIAKQAETCGIKSSVYLCDTFTGVVKAGENDSAYRGGEHADTSRPVVEDLIEKLQLKNIKILAGIFPDETSQYIEEENFYFDSLTYLDKLRSVRYTGSMVYNETLLKKSAKNRICDFTSVHPPPLHSQNLLKSGVGSV